MGKLELKLELGGPRNYLDGRPLHAGEILEVRLSDGSWTEARYEYHWDRKATILDAYFLIPRAGSPDTDTCLPAHSTWCRWPA